jgi:hypothetical protein
VNNPDNQCGEVGTSWPNGGVEPKFTEPCPLPLNHDGWHDWNEQRDCGHREGPVAGCTGRRCTS